MSEEVILKVGLTPRHPCSYLGHEQEQLLVLMDQWLRHRAQCGDVETGLAPVPARPAR